jgi:hypothetical protein
VIVNDVERLVLAGGRVDRLERSRNVIGLEQRPLDVLGMRSVEQRMNLGSLARARGAEELDLVTLLDERIAEQGHNELDPAIAGWRNRDPWRREHCDPEASVLRALDALAIRHVAPLGGKLDHVVAVVRSSAWSRRRHDQATRP